MDIGVEGWRIGFGGASCGTGKLNNKARVKAFIVSFRTFLTSYSQNHFERRSRARS
ncbi:hypothetical protein SBA1_1340026 [Candidatus Sulfotelmatobacter kueseliae]|uniref:Uncharacterized protein n=1 Tax=Candidatus Sulfotelmatobacter kueseliae TaxID=2042962 RepID=A0A2U3K590_9BACT|nr:hypothetical protein SBA1_1340026 [Candidatus Sulfotelmatobacter kueseliae]